MAGAIGVYTIQECIIHDTILGEVVAFNRECDLRFDKLSQRLAENARDNNTGRHSATEDPPFSSECNPLTPLLTCDFHVGLKVRLFIHLQANRISLRNGRTEQAKI